MENFEDIIQLASDFYSFLKIQPFPSGHLQDFFLFLIFRSFTVICLEMVFIIFILSAVFKWFINLWLDVFQGFVLLCFLILGHYLIIYCYFLSPPSSFSRTVIIYMLTFSCKPYIYTLFSVFLILLLLFLWDLSYSFFWFVFLLWILFLAEFNRLINSSIELLMSAIMFFSSEIIIWVFCCFPFICQNYQLHGKNFLNNWKPYLLSVDLFLFFMISLVFLLYWLLMWLVNFY